MLPETSTLHQQTMVNLPRFLSPKAPDQSQSKKDVERGADMLLLLQRYKKEMSNISDPKGRSYYYKMALIIEGRPLYATQLMHNEEAFECYLAKELTNFSKENLTSFFSIDVFQHHGGKLFSLKGTIGDDIYEPRTDVVHWKLARGAHSRSGDKRQSQFSLEYCHMDLKRGHEDVLRKTFHCMQQIFSHSTPKGIHRAVFCSSEYVFW